MSFWSEPHREIYRFYTKDDVVIVELAPQGTHEGNFYTGGSVRPPTGKKMDSPCCDVFHLKNGKVRSFHCYNLPSVILQQLDVLGNLDTALKRRAARLPRGASRAPSTHNTPLEFVETLPSSPQKEVTELFGFLTPAGSRYRCCEDHQPRPVC